MRRWFGCVICLVVVGCAAGAPSPAKEAPLPPYTPEDSALFNDAFRPELFGTPGAHPPEHDPLFGDRVARASSVVPVKVVTLTREGGEKRSHYFVEVEATAEALAGAALSKPLSLVVSATSPIYATFVGTRLLLFVQHFADGPHFYGTADTASVREAVARARVKRLVE